MKNEYVCRYYDKETDQFYFLTDDPYVVYDNCGFKTNLTIDDLHRFVYTGTNTHFIDDLGDFLYSGDIILVLHDSGTYDIGVIRLDFLDKGIEKAYRSSLNDNDYHFLNDDEHYIYIGNTEVTPRWYVAFLCCINLPNDLQEFTPETVSLRSFAKHFKISPDDDVLNDEEIEKFLAQIDEYERDEEYYYE